MDDINKNIEPHSLIVKYLANEASKEEITLLENWVIEDEANKNTFNDYKQAFVLSNLKKTSKEIDIDKEWGKLESKLSLGRIIQLDKNEKGSKTGFSKYYSIAASVIVLLSLTFVLYYLFSKSGKEQYIAENEVTLTTLADGSEVTLNHNTTLTYYKKTEDKRKVKLEGDAFFEVKPDASKPFVIETQNVEVEVLGTSFYVNSHESRPTIEVVVNTGKVAFKIKNGNTLILTTGEKGVFDKKTGELIHEENNDVNFIAWKTKHLEFENSKFSDVIHQIASTYHIDVKIVNPDINNCRITVIFDNQSLDAVLNILAETLDLDIEKRDDKVIVSGSGCF